MGVNAFCRAATIAPANIFWANKPVGFSD